MGTQLIICVETNKKCQSDYLYIKSAIDYFYDMNRTDIRLSPVYMNGKGNYSSKKIKKRIDELSKLYKATSINNSSIVICCVDCDDYKTKPEEAIFLENVKSFCNENGYHFVWFCKDIEMVFLGDSIPDSKKKSSANMFKSKQMISQIRIQNLRASEFQDKRSNLCNVLDTYLKEK